MEKPEVVLTRKRDFSDVINATFSFLSQEIKPYARVILVYAALPLLAATIITTIYSTKEMSNLVELIRGGGIGITSVPDLGIMAAMYLFTIVAYVFLMGLTASYLKLYSEKGRRTFTSEEVWNGFIKSIGTHVLLILLTVVFLVLISAVGGLITALMGFFMGSGSGVFTAIAVFILVMGFMMFLIYIMVPLTFAYYTIYSENTGVIAAAKRGFSLVSGNWWFSFGVLFILTIIVFVLSSLFSIPVLITTLVKGFVAVQTEAVSGGPSLTLILTSLLSTIGSYLIYPIVFVGCGIQYYNLRMQKDNEDLLQKVSEITID
jgi:hypothetical protein